jgi:hypothetical protein
MPQVLPSPLKKKKSACPAKKIKNRRSKILLENFG